MIEIGINMIFAMVCGFPFAIIALWHFEANEEIHFEWMLLFGL